MRTMQKVTIVILLGMRLSTCVRPGYDQGLITSTNFDAQSRDPKFSDSARVQELWLRVREHTDKIYNTSLQGPEGEEVVSKVTVTSIQGGQLAMPNGWQDVRVQGIPELKGQGKYGRVYLAKLTCGDDPEVKQVAVKEVSFGNDEEKDQVEMEAWSLKILSRSSDPLVPRYLRQFIDLEENRTWIMTRWASGGSFRDLIHNGLSKNVDPKENLKTRLWLFCDMMRGLEELHDHGMVHRDLKPENLLVSETCEGDCRALIADLGLICYEGDGKEITRMVGTPIYLAPEVSDGQGASRKNDVWAAGIILYELLFLEPHIHEMNFWKLMCWKLPAADSLPRSYKELAEDLGSGIQGSWIQEVLEGMLAGARKECNPAIKADPTKRWTASEVLQSKFMKKVAEFRTTKSSKDDLSKCKEEDA